MIEPVTVSKRQKNKNHSMDISENHTDNSINNTHILKIIPKKIIYISMEKHNFCIITVIYKINEIFY